MNKLGLYIHIPFCRSKCAYCDFYSLPGALDRAEDYINALCRQFVDLSAFCACKTVDSVYIGGGTPSILDPRLTERILSCVQSNYRLDDDCEITTEANPATVSMEALKDYLSFGINRVSFGVQTSSDKTLARIGRAHTFAQALSSVCDARLAGFENLSADLIYGLPLQGRNEIPAAIDALIRAGVAHISLYGLKIEPNTPFGKRKDLDQILPGEDEQCGVYLNAVEQMEKHGVLQYEISNFARPGFESRHNLRYWTREEYLGFGPGAHSFFEGVRFCLERDLEAYMSEYDFSLSSDVYKEKKRITEREAFEEGLMLSLRLTRGFETQKLLSACSDPSAADAYLSALEKGGLMRVFGERFALTPRGMLVSNSIISDLLLRLKD